MTFNEKYNVGEDYQHLFNFSENDQIALDALWLAAQFLNPIQAAIQLQGITYDTIATQVGITPDELHELFGGDKLPTFEIIIKLQLILDIHFDINAKLLRPTTLIKNNEY
ncbi:MAG: helix-turn-helix transcriptional regulator [Spirosomataceae bacterium]